MAVLLLHFSGCAEPVVQIEISGKPPPLSITAEYEIRKYDDKLLLHAWIHSSGSTVDRELCLRAVGVLRNKLKTCPKPKDPAAIQSLNLNATLSKGEEPACYVIVELR